MARYLVDAVRGKTTVTKSGAASVEQYLTSLTLVDAVYDEVWIKCIQQILNLITAAFCSNIGSLQTLAASGATKYRLHHNCCWHHALFSYI